jgi:hypothetical protein
MSEIGVPLKEWIVEEEEGAEIPKYNPTPNEEEHFDWEKQYVEPEKKEEVGV